MIETFLTSACIIENFYSHGRNSSMQFKKVIVRLLFFRTLEALYQTYGVSFTEITFTVRTRSISITNEIDVLINKIYIYDIFNIF